MHKDKPEDLAAQLKARQQAVAAAMDDLKEELKPEALAEMAKQKAAEAVRGATLDQRGRPKPWVLITVSVVVALLATGIALRFARRAK
jgi:ABC-type cobalamin transport system permease subunit